MLRLSAYFLLLSALLVSGCQGETGSNAVTDIEREPLATGSGSADLQVYKSPTCGCCGEWIEHVQHHGFTTAVHHPDDLDVVKREQGIEPGVQSCHTAVSTGGYVFEGHVPARDIERFLEQPPEGALGLAVPGMPLGSPGMEVGDRFTPYDIVLLKKDGSHEVYRHVASAEEQ